MGGLINEYGIMHLLWCFNISQLMCNVCISLLKYMKFLNNEACHCSNMSESDRSFL